MPRSIGVRDVGMRSLYSGLHTPSPDDVGADPGGRGPKVPMLHTFLTPGPASFTVLRGGFYRVIAYGGGGKGGTSAGFAASQGGGGGAAMRKMYLRKGQVVLMSVAPERGNTIITLPDGSTLGGLTGGNGTAGFEPGGAGGGAFGGDINRAGGQGLGSLNPDGDPDTDDGEGTGSPGEGNSAGGPNSGAAFFEYVPSVTAGQGGAVAFGTGFVGQPGAAAIVGPEN